MSPAKSFKTFLRSKRFGDFRSQDRDDFFSDIRNGILHNGETRKDWKVRIDTKGMLDRVAGTRILNPRRFHAAIIREWRDLDRALRSADSDARTKFLQRMNAIAGLIAQPKFYFAYGSNLRDEECRRSAPHAEAHSRAFLPNFRLVFEKHSHTRGGDAATIIPDPTRVVWGFLYRVTDQDLKGLVAREAGYTCCEKLVYVPGGENQTPALVKAIVFVANGNCSQLCGPTADYLDIVRRGATERDLPPEYLRTLDP
ncbi:MAG: gamma-glutamylcyclotransferase family protein [Acidobacteriota bacterium]